MKKKYFKYIESLFFLLVLIFLIKFKVSEDKGYLVDFSFGKLFLSFDYIFFITSTNSFCT